MHIADESGRHKIRIEMLIVDKKGTAIVQRRLMLRPPVVMRPKDGRSMCRKP